MPSKIVIRLTEKEEERKKEEKSILRRKQGKTTTIKKKTNSVYLLKVKREIIMLNKYNYTYTKI